jgi:hypothetical protein
MSGVAPELFPKGKAASFGGGVNEPRNFAYRLTSEPLKPTSPEYHGVFRIKKTF